MPVAEQNVAAIQEFRTSSPAEPAAVQQELMRRVGSLEKSLPEDRLSLVVFSGDLDRLYAAFTLATGAAAMGSEVSMFFTFWGLSAVKKETLYKGKNIWERLLTFVLPSGPKKVPSSNLNLMGLGPRFFNLMMTRKGSQTLPEMIDLAIELDVEMHGCQMSMDIMGYRREELLDNLGYCGVAAFLGNADKSRNTLFI